eukprot:TRINITY_DN68510_c0_g1_i1.p1 TRINITY_DN68510_c0_g1~~TRINITY_DN68510_c0_g1_i1.p1  ORF type:complete len:514 (+),score=87.77 TRINITY_DN68510_c0_g1_i1:181-1722(+)
MASTGPIDTCLFLGEWERCRFDTHASYRQRAETVLCDLQLRVRSAASSLDAWILVAESRKKLEMAAAAALSNTMEELEATWRPQRLEAIDGGAATWLLTSERAHAANLASRAALWGGVVPAESASLKRRYQSLCELVSPSGDVVSCVRAWDTAHEVAVKAWQSHNERLAAADRAQKEDQAPPDSWLSEVQYREKGREHIKMQTVAVNRLVEVAETLARLEIDRTTFWDSFAVAYTRTQEGSRTTSTSVAVCSTPPQVRSQTGESAGTDETPSQEPSGGLGSDASALSPPVMPDIPSNSGAVLWRKRVVTLAPNGYFGFGGGGWRDSAILVLTIHGYLHLFAVSNLADSSRQNEGTKPSEDKSVCQSKDHTEESNEELVESDIRASVYVPLATRCVFQKRGKECTLDVAEPEAVSNATTGSTVNAASSAGVNQNAHEGSAGATVEGTTNTVAKGSATNSGTGGALMRWIRRDKEVQPVPRRVQARVTSAEDFADLERRCHDFVRRGQCARANRC